VPHKGRKAGVRERLQIHLPVTLHKKTKMAFLRLSALGRPDDAKKSLEEEQTIL
jgi:hypothetical protein